ncbi:hypothetical protein PEC301645_25700 [Pectobacterium carotovorum subsp. carotovorum]|uniref:Uncharacterized protein n=1 Tax=Pectobacterium carotovorum subsp. carotovorum (strain PC1) TaxID=561230 RepID=C6DD27_PECCP|nr:hypothetical protein PC1_1359 [Pectobacterium carotovorum subsp. carotovorum PC1]GKV95123.1 hypothetical protein PEC301645_25700 [Pectobacterium carotovorum subsp. carotovorum]
MGETLCNGVRSLTCYNVVGLENYDRFGSERAFQLCPTPGI